MRWIPVWALVVGCSSGDGPGTDSNTSDPSNTDVTPGVPLDPDVDSYLPAGWAPSAPQRVVYLGDSIAAGVGATRPNLAYTSLLTEDTSQKWSANSDLDLESLFGTLEVVDVSQGGATTDSLIQRQLPALNTAVGDTASGETIVVMTIGGNDAQQALNPFADANAVVDNLVDNLEYVVLELQDQFPDGAYIYLTNVYEPSDGVGQTSDCFFGIDYGDKLPLLDEADDIVRGMAEEYGFAMLDMRGHFRGHGFYYDDASLDVHHPDDVSIWFDSDCIHPNDRGHHEIRRLYHAAIAGVDLPLEP